MKHYLLRTLLGVLLIIALLTILCIPGFAATARVTQNWKVQNYESNAVKLTLQSVNQNTNFIEAYSGSTLKFAIKSTGQPIYLDSGTSVASGDGTVTNTFTRAFSSTPTVVSCQVGINTTTTNVLSITPSNFVTTTAKSGTTNRWIAFGPP